MTTKAPLTAALTGLLLGQAGCFTEPVPNSGGGDESGTTSASTGSPGQSGSDSEQGSSSTDETTTDATSTSTTSDSAGSSGTTSQANLCPDPTHVCVPPAPADWQGPVALLAVIGGGPQPECGTDFPDEVFGPVGEFDVGESTCECDCDDPGTVTCSGVEVKKGATACSGSGTSIGSVGPDECVDIGGTSAATDYWVTNSLAVSGYCEPIPNEVIPEPELINQILGCSAPAAEAECEADGDLCLPIPADPFEDRLCIYRLGDQACPDPAHDDLHVLYGDFEDTRACSTCDCGEPEGLCVGAVSLTSGCLPGATLYGEVATGDCDGVGTGVSHMRLAVAAGPAVQCPPTDTVLEGDVGPIESVTICCMTT